jgi:CubicO group peptidase (beta-lactamase class C family)
MTAGAETLAHQVIEDAIRARVFPAATSEVGDERGPIWTTALGTLSFDPGSPATALDTPFDLASLTKPIATTSAVMLLDASGQLALDDRVARFFAEWLGDDREAVTIGDLLEHASGLPARLVDAPPETRREFEHEICTIRLEYAPRTQSIYSDLGFILLAFLAADAGGADLAAQFSSLWPNPMLAFALDPAAARRAAPTLPLPQDPRRGRTLVGEVHDNYAAALGGVAGHAGLFGTAAAVGAFARTMLRAARGHAGEPAPFTPEQVARFTRRSPAGVPGSSRALGWDTMLPTSSCGTRMSSAAFGHVGFTGTSLWIDPPRDRYVVLLTNRVCGGGSVEAMRDVRRAFHDAVGDL